MVSVSVRCYLGRDPVDESLVDLGQHEEIKADHQSAAAHERRRERKDLHSHGVVRCQRGILLSFCGSDRK